MWIKTNGCLVHMKDSCFGVKVYMSIALIYMSIKSYDMMPFRVRIQKVLPEGGKIVSEYHQEIPQSQL